VNPLQRKMNLCFITRSLPFGKFEAFLIPEVLYFLRAGHSVSVVPLRAEGEVVHQDARSLMDCTLDIPLVNSAILAAFFIECARNPLVVAKLLICICRSRTLKIFMQNMAVFPKALWLARYFRSTVIPDHIHAYWISTAATMAMIAATVLKVPWSVTAHRGDIAMNNLIAAKAADCCFVRCINENGAAEVHQLSGALDKVRVLHLGIDIPEMNSGVDERKKPEDMFKILTPANFVEVKGHLYLLQAIRLLIDEGETLHLDLAGDGELSGRIQQYIAKFGLSDHVSLLGEISHSTLLHQLFSGHWDCVALPSIVTADGAKEGIPVSLMESMAAGIPVVATATGGIPELCGEGAALLVQEKNPAALAAALKRVKHDPETRDRMIEVAKTRVHESYNIKKVGPVLAKMMAEYTRTKEAKSQ
jgi:glycosyltransferase involved in cell wall biosynthesis